MDSKSDVRQQPANPNSAPLLPALQVATSALPGPAASTSSSVSKDPQPNIALTNFNFGAFQLSSANANVNTTANMVPISQRNIFYDTSSTSIQMHKQQITHQTGMNLNANSFHATAPSHSSTTTTTVKEEVKPTTLNSSCFSCSSLRLPTCHTTAFGQPESRQDSAQDCVDTIKGANIVYLYPIPSLRCLFLSLKALYHTFKKNA
ncbi:unnamed protein product [Brugia pahangi]|uniref:Uncharacterized protein n=1 Tax=Brugia pahangi TaxID=6280 RepID=A0A0N4TIA9_BRUPA|nr:unnamed protein product [Brugia pahangi]